MSAVPDKVTVVVPIDLPDNVPKYVKDDIRKQVGDYLTIAVMDYLGDAKTPVKGGKYDPVLSQEYADKMKGGRTEANLNLEGDMIAALTHRPHDSGLEFGIFDKSQVPKAYNHNVGDTLPHRQFIPGEGQKFEDEIEDGIRLIIEERAGQYESGEFEKRTAPRREPTDEDPYTKRVNLVSKVLRTESVLTSFVRGVLDGAEEN